MMHRHRSTGSHLGPASRTFTFIVPTGFYTQRLAHMLDSLVRVSRRVAHGHLDASVLSAFIPLHRLATPPSRTLRAVLSLWNKPDDGQLAIRHALQRSSLSSVRTRPSTGGYNAQGKPRATFPPCLIA